MKVNSLVHYIKQTLISKKVEISWLFLLNLIFALLVIYFDEEPKEVLIRVHFLLMCMMISIGTLSVYALLIRWLPDKFSKLFWWTICLVTGGLFFVEVFSLFMFNTDINSNMVMLLMGTNGNEASEFFSVYVFSAKSAAVIAGTSLTLVGTWFLARKVASVVEYLSGFTVGVLVICGLLANIFNIYHSSYECFGITSPGRYMDKYFIVREYMDELELARISAEQYDSPILYANGAANIVLIIGESTTKNYMGLYGYPLPTNPLLGQRMQSGQLIRYDNVVSAYSITIKSLISMLTFKNRATEQNWWEYWNIIDIMKTAGYRVEWLSNQEPKSIFANITTMFAQRSDKVVFNEQKSRLDEDLFPHIRLSAANSGKNFTVVHLMGTHARYKKRYPENFDVIKAAQIERDLGEKEKRVMAEYANALLYNDYVVNEVIKYYENKDAVVIYLSDHGQDVFDTSKSYAGNRGIGQECRYGFDIPFLVWMSNEFQRKHPQAANNIAGSAQNRYMSDELTHTIFDIAQITGLEGYKPELSIINPMCNVERERIVNGRADYDEELLHEKSMKMQGKNSSLLNSIYSNILRRIQ